MGLQYPNVIHAGGSMGTTASVWSAGGVLSKSATGTYLFTLDDAVDAAECAVLVTLRGSTGAYSVAQTSDSVKTITTFAVDGTTATDKAFDVFIFRAPGG